MMAVFPSGTSRRTWLWFAQGGQGSFASLKGVARRVNTSAGKAGLVATGPANVTGLLTFTLFESRWTVGVLFTATPPGTATFGVPLIPTFHGPLSCAFTVGVFWTATFVVPWASVGTGLVVVFTTRTSAAGSDVAVPSA